MRPRVRILYEYGQDGLPYSSGYLRLLQPLGYPGVEANFQVSAGPDFHGDAELVIVERLWRPDVTLPLAQALVERVRRAGARLIYALDDALLDLPPDHSGVFPPQFREIVQLFVDEADALLLTTPALAQQLAATSPPAGRTLLLPHALDERLLSGPPVARLWQPNCAVLGYMGTPTHDDDLALILPALARVQRQSPVPIRLEVIGGAARPETWQRLRSLPFPVRRLQPPSPLYPSFLAWFGATVRWDIALAPLCDTIFNSCKSDVKFLDYSAVGAAGVYSRSPAYASVVHGQTGLLSDNSPDAWADALLRLLCQPALRGELSGAAWRHLYQQRVLARRVNDWLAGLEQVWYA